jgi:excisionase family DNA binding protein
MPTSLTKPLRWRCFSVQGGGAAAQRRHDARALDRAAHHPPRNEGRGVMSEQANPARLLTAEDVAERLGVGVKWVWAQARAGNIPHVRLGRYQRFRSEAIDAWIADLEEGGGD